MATAYDGDRITEIARRQLRASGYAAVRRVHCYYDEGVLVLIGAVPSYHQKQLAQAAVAGFCGIERLCNRIRVSDGDPWDEVPKHFPSFKNG